MLKHLASQGPSADPVTHVDALPISRESLPAARCSSSTTIQLPDMLATRPNTR